MYECPNCGGNLKFDIESQLLKCDYCQTTKDPYEVTKDNDAQEYHDFDVTVFTCPQCGGEILSTDTSAAEFCSFCGASTILSSRISKEKRPSRIIPFKVTKDACKEAYVSRMKRAVFAPNELKDPKYIDSFRGIYMPYYAYHISQKGAVHLNGEKSYRQGDYLYKEQYALSGDIDAEYPGLPYDASSSFSDSISECVAPFHEKDMKQFTPSFLSGFYADTADVDSTIYEQNALEIANIDSFGKVKSSSVFSGVTLSGDNNAKNLSAILGTSLKETERVMYPVWFMSYRKNDRVAYVTVNGQTGKIAADIPIDIKKYSLGTLLLSLVLFVILNLFFTIKPTTLLGYAFVLSIITIILSLTESRRIRERDSRIGDKGYQFHLKEHKLSATSASKTGTGFVGSLFALIVSMLIFFLNPVSDLWYYGGAFLSLLGVFATIIDIIRKYNVLATRKLPQFDRKGGNDHA